jgi:hypothetical protein
MAGHASTCRFGEVAMDVRDEMAKIPREEIVASLLVDEGNASRVDDPFHRLRGEVSAVHTGDPSSGPGTCSTYFSGVPFM